VLVNLKATGDEATVDTLDLKSTLLVTQNPDLQLILGHCSRELTQEEDVT